jgi:cytochrome b561
MSLNQARVRYSHVAIVLHWTIALMILCNVALAWLFDSLPDAWVRPAIDTHKSIGITVLGLALMRVLWRLGHAPPPLPAEYPRWERTAAHLVHGALYLLIVALPLSGWMHDSAWKDAADHSMQWFHLFEWPRIGLIMHIEPAAKERLHTLFGQVHASLAYVLYALFVLHVGGALKHQFLDKHAELERMSF